MAFQKGQSGNPGGRPKVVADIKELARKYTKEAVEALVKALKAKSEHTRVAAAEALLDRGYGRPQQTIDMNVRSSLADDLDAIAAEEAAIAPLAGESASLRDGGVAGHA